VAWIQKLKRTDGTTSYKVYWRDPSRRIRTKTYRLRKDADRWIREVEHQKDVGTYVDLNLGQVPFSVFWDHFIRTSPPPAESTRALYAMQARTHILPHLGSVPLQRLTKPMIKSFLADLHEEGVRDPSINGAYRLLRRVLSVAVEEGRIAQNPAARIQAPKSAPGEMNFLSAKEVDSLSRAVDERYEALILFLAFTGIRIGEAAALRMRNVDFLKRQVTIVEASKEVEGKLYLGPTKNRRNRSVTLPSFLSDKLVKHVEQFSSPGEPEALVFLGPSGDVLRQTAFRNRVFKPAVARLGLAPSLRPKDLRHTAVALAIQANWHPRTIQEMLGHSSIEVTLGTYGHLFDSLHGEGADRLDAIYAEAARARDSDVVDLSSRIHAS
jgi:integrase